MSEGPTLHIKHDARFECEGAVAELREGHERMLLTYGNDPTQPLRDNEVKASLTEREAVALAAVLHGAINWFREASKRGSA